MGVAGALLEAAARGDAARLASILKADDRDVNVTDEIGRSALQRAAAEGHVQAVQLLLQHGADPNHQDSVYGNTAAHEAAWKGYSSTLQVLGRSGADLRVLNNAGFTALHFACQNGHNQSCRELLLAGAPPDLQNTYGDTALHTAARYGHAGVSRILVSAACGVSRANRNGDSALHIAAAMGRRKLTRVLLDAGAARALRNQQGETARDIAARKGLADILRILDAPAAAAKPDKKRRGKSKERTLDEPAPDNDRAKDKKKKKSVHFEAPPAAPWSPYGCHYYPDPKFFPKPRLDSLPPDPLRKGEQYYLDLAGNIKKGPVGAGYACYCAPFFKHMEHKLDEDKRDLKRHIDRAHERLDRKVTDLEARTHGQISELTRAVAAERALCLARHHHLEQWVARGAAGRASERPRRPPHSPRGSLHVPPLKRTRSLEILDTDEWNRVHKVIQSFNENCERFETDAKDLSESRVTSKSSEALERRAASPARRPLTGSRSSERLDARERRLPAEPHVIDNEVFESQSPLSIGMSGLAPRYPSSRRSEAKSPVRPPPPAADMQKEPAPAWKSQVLQRTADDIKKRVELEREMSEVISRNDKSLDISQDGYVRLRKHQKEEPVARESRKSVQELVAQVEQQRCTSPSPIPFPRTIQPTERAECPPPAPPHPPHPSILKMSQQPQRPAPVLKEKPPKSKRFSLHNLIPFPTRKTFQPPPRDNGNESESSDEEDHPIRSTAQPGPARNASLLQTLPLPNYEAVSNGSPSPGLPIFPHDCRPMVPKDAYFHEIPNRQMPYRDLENGPAHVPRPWDYNRAGLPPPAEPRSRNPLQPQTGVFDAMMHDHVLREMERAPHCYSERLHQNTEVEIANRNGPYRGAYCDNGYSAAGERGLLHSRLQSLAINTQLAAGAGAAQPDRESHNDSGYSTKVSQGPSPSLSGAGPLGTSSLV